MTEIIALICIKSAELGPRQENASPTTGHVFGPLVAYHVGATMPITAGICGEFAIWALKPMNVQQIFRYA